MLPSCGDKKKGHTVPRYSVRLADARTNGRERSRTQGGVANYGNLRRIRYRRLKKWAICQWYLRNDDNRQKRMTVRALQVATVPSQSNENTGPGRISILAGPVLESKFVRTCETLYIEQYVQWCERGGQKPPLSDFIQAAALCARMPRARMASSWE